MAANGDLKPGVDKTSNDVIDPKLVRKLADILRETELTEIEVERGELKIRVARKISVQAAPQVFAAAPAAVAAPAVAQSAATVTVDAPVAASEPKGDIIPSPMVGTVYLQSQPGTPPFIKVGDTVASGQTLLIIEAMKTMNPIAAPRAGTVVEIIAKDAQPVEFGAPLVVLA
jgi:acetyl-CoA carboxylase biotin carboxyl carrier protein